MHIQCLLGCEMEMKNIDAMFTCSSDYVFYDLQRNVFVADFTNCSPFVHLFVELGRLFLHIFLGQAIVKPGIRYMYSFAFSTGSKSQWIWRRYSSDVGILQRIYINRIAWCLRLKNSAKKLGNEESSQNRDNIRPVIGQKRRGEFHNHPEPIEPSRQRIKTINFMSAAFYRSRSRKIWIPDSEPGL